MTQIRNYAIERLASTVFDDDLLDIQIMEAGGDQYEEARMKVSELRKLMNDGATPLRYKCLLSQHALIPSQTSGSLPSDGMIITIVTYVAGDDFSNWELISGSENTTGAVYRATTDTPDVWSNGSDISYDGSPFIVSTNQNGDISPFINTTGANPIFEYGSSSKFYVTLTGLLKADKTIAKIGNSDISGTNLMVVYTEEDDDRVTIKAASGTLYYTPFELEIYP